MNPMPRILVVEDEMPMRTVLQNCLTRSGYRVLAAHDGESGLAMALREKPDLILLDIMMPGQDGFQVLDLIRKRSSIPIIMLTAKCEVTAVQRAIFAGADDYVIKPFSILVLTARIRAKLRRAIPEILGQTLQN